METIKVGDTEFKVSRQAIIVFCMTLFSYLVILGVTLKSVKIRGPASYLAVAIGGLIFVLYAYLVGYIVNCTVVGACIKVSWAMAILYSLLGGFYLLVALGYVAMPSRGLLADHHTRLKKTKR